MAKDSAQSKIPRLGAATRIPATLSATIRIPTASAHHHHLHHQKAQLISGNNNKIARPSTFTGLCPSVTTMASIKKSLSGDRITEAACIVGKKANANVKKFLTKPEKLSHNVVGDVTTVKMLNRDETIILDKGMKDDANQKLMITGGGILNQQQQQQQQGNQNYFNKHQTSSSETNTDNILNVTRTLTKSETFIRDKNNDDDGSTHNKNISADDEHSNEDDLNNTIVPFVEKQEQTQYQEQHQQQMQSSEIRHFDLNNIVFDKNTSDSSLSKTRTIEMTPILDNITVTLETNSKLHCNMAVNYSNERLSDISIPSCDLDVTIQQNKDGVDRFENEGEGHDEKIDTFENLNSALTLAPDKDEFEKVLNSTVNTERLLDITSNKSPSYQLMNLTRELSESQNYEQNNTKLLYMTTSEMTSAVLGSKYTPEHHSETTSIDEQMEIDEPQKSEENIFDIPANMNQVLSSQVVQELKQNKPRYSFGLDLTECTLDCSIDLCDVSLSSSTAQITSPSLKKQNSFEMDESLGILTPNQMKEFLDSTATTTNLDLPINIQQTGNKLVLHQMRIDQTPSPEDLPLDPVGVKTDITDVIMMQPPTAPVQNLITYQEISQTDSDSKTDQMTKSTASKVSNSFITSVTSITSLDTGYQGDGEMSRPASRGPADHSPSNGPRKPHLGRQPSFNQHNPPNIPIRRQDPMTDSDFFTESDADDIFHRGDRRAQVIDGQLYGPMLQPANVFISEQPQMEDSCMESSGIFTDVENRCDDELSRSRREADIDMSPDSSTDTVKSNNADYNNDSGNNNNNNTQIQLQRSLSPMSQSNSNSNILTDSQTSSTIQSSLSSDRISGCSVANDCSVIVQQQLKRNANINSDVLISNSSKSLSNSSSIGALNINLNNSQNDDNDKTSLIPQIHGTDTAITTEVIGIAPTSTVQQAPTSQPSISLSPLVKKLSPSRKQQFHNIVGGKHESKTNVNVNDNVTKTGGDSINTKSTNIGGNVKKSINSDQCDKINDPGVNNSDDNISAGDGDNRSMLEKSSARKGVNNSIGNQENKRPGSIVVTSPIATVANNVVSVSQTSPTPRKVMVNKWDAVMNKIAENKTTYKKNYSEVKSKVACGVLKRGTKTDANKSPISGKQSQINSNCGSLNSINGLSSPKTPSGKRVTQCATKRGHSYSKDSQQSSQSDLSLSGGSPKIHTKSGGNSRSAKKRDVRTLTISPTDLGPPPKSQTNSSSSRAKQTPQILLQKRLSPNNLQQLSSSLSISNKNSPPPAKKVITRRPQAQQKPQQSHTKTPLKDHNRLINQTQSQQQQQQQLNHLNGSPKIAGNVIKGISPSNTTPNTPLQQVTGNCLKSSHTTPIATSPILNDNSVINAPSSILHSVQSHKKHLQHLQQQQQQQQQKEQKTCKEAALELHLAHANKSVEALGVLLQYLAYDLDAFTCPSVKKDYANTQKNLIETRLLLEDAKSSCHELQDQLQDKDAYYIARESEIQALHRCELNKVESSLIEIESNAKDRIAALENQLAAKDADYEKKLQEYNKINEEKFANYEKQVQVAKEKEQELLKRINVLSTTENELRDKIQATENSFADRLRLAGIRERELTEKINSLNKQLDELRQKKVNCEREFEDKLNLYHDEISVLRLSKSSIDQISSPKNGATINGDVSLTGANRVQMLQNEVESLRSVLELKQAEVSELRIKNQEMRRAADELPAMQMKVSALESRIEDLQIQLKARAEEDKELIQKNKHLQESLSHEIQNRTRLSLHNEELQWRLKQNSKKFALTLAEFSKNSNQDNAGSLNSSISRTSINSQENLYLSHNSSLLSSTRVNGSERNMIGCFEMDDVSPPASPIIKGVVEKNDSVSWVLEMDDESPEVVASRMVRRAGSFRSSFNEKSPGGSKRHDLFLGPNIIINPLTQSASATSVLRQHSNESMCETPRQANSRIRSKSVTIKSPEQKKIARQSSISGTSSSRKSEPPLSSSWKDPIYCSSPYTRRSSSSRSPPKDVSPHLLLGVVSSTSSSSSSTLTLTSTKARERTDSFNTDTDNGLFNQKHEPNLITCDTSALASAAERIEMRSLPTHPSVQDLKNLKKCQEIQESAGEAMVSGTNSEDEGCSASSDEAVSSNSSTTTSSLGTGKQHNIDCILIEKINCSLGGTPMEVSWSDDGDQFPSESVV